MKAHTLLGHSAIEAGHAHGLSREDLRRAIEAFTDISPMDQQLDDIIKAHCGGQQFIPLEQFRSLFTSGVLQPVHQGRYWVAVSLAEAETIRRILHVRKQGHPQQLLSAASTEVALHYSPLCAPGGSKAGDGGVVFDASWGWRQGTRATAFEASVAHSSFRFFDCDMHFAPQAINVLLRVLRSR